MSDAKKVQCSKCERMIDKRGLLAHTRTHEAKPANVKKVRSYRMKKKDPISASFDLEVYLRGYKRGLEEAKVA